MEEVSSMVAAHAALARAGVLNAATERRMVCQGRAPASAQHLPLINQSEGVSFQAAAFGLSVVSRGSEKRNGIYYSCGSCGSVGVVHSYPVGNTGSVGDRME